MLAWFRKHEDIPVLGSGFGISRGTAYRYHDDGIRVLAEHAPICTRRWNRPNRMVLPM